MAVMLVEWVITSVFLILVVLALRAVLGKRMSARLRYALWAVVLVRLLVPVQLFTSPLAGTRIFSESRMEQNIYNVTDNGLEKGGPDDILALGGQDGPEAVLTAFPQAPNSPTLPDAPEPPAAPDLTKAPAWLGWVWLAGSAAVALILLVSNLRFYWRLRRERIPMESADCPLRVYAAVGLPSPCLFGLFRPAMYVTPEAAADPDMLRHVLAHEYTHYRQGDHLWSLLRCAALAAHWWNPLVWLAAVLSQRDAELACDEGALKRLGDGERAGYGNTLLALVTAKPRPVDLFRCATTMAGDKKSLKERISRIAKAPKRVIWAVVVAVLVTALACVCAFGQAEEEPDTEEDPWPYDSSEVLFARDAGGFVTDFTIRLAQSGWFTYYEGGPSSFIGMGTWTRDGNVICLTDDRMEDKIYRYYFRVEDGALVFQAKHSAEFMYVDVADGDRFSQRPITGSGWEAPPAYNAEHPVADLNRNGVPETLQVVEIDGGQRLEVWENGKQLFSEEGYFAHAGYNALFLCTLDGEDYLLRYHPSMGQGWCDYSYQLFTLTQDGQEQVVRENSIEFDINFGLTHESFDPEAIAAFMDEINGLLANSTQLINTDEDLLSAFEKEGRLYDSLWWLDAWGPAFVRDPSKSLLENLRDFKEAMEVRGNGDGGYASVLLGRSQFILREPYADSERHANIVDAPAVFDPYDTYMKLWNFAVVDLDGDGADEVLVYACGVAGDMGGYLLLHQEAGNIYGMAFNSTISGHSCFLELKTDGTFKHLDPTGTDWMSITRVGFRSTGYVIDDLASASASDHGDFDSFLVNHQEATKAEFEAVLAAQDAKPDAVWYDFTEENIYDVFLKG